MAAPRIRSWTAPACRVTVSGMHERHPVVPPGARASRPQHAGGSSLPPCGAEAGSAALRRTPEQEECGRDARAPARRPLRAGSGSAAGASRLPCRCGRRRHVRPEPRGRRAESPHRRRADPCPAARPPARKRSDSARRRRGSDPPHRRRGGCAGNGEKHAEGRPAHPGQGQGHVHPPRPADAAGASTASAALPDGRCGRDARAPRTGAASLLHASRTAPPRAPLARPDPTRLRRGPPAHHPAGAWVRGRLARTAGRRAA